ncbi:MAG: T9SS type A sorting domain-containing protein [Bacteroidia bacterium]|nr:T9SS type A sorting domain-containing protein [Bacteroidia bacterium]MBP7245107.1 T9SS type A sorting domain-containing protein [Bacteroidia bacterium]
MDTTIRLLNSCSYWDLTRSTGSSNVYVSLYWDSIGCGLYDTLGLVVSTWDGSSWKNIGNTSTTGNVLSGKVKSGSVATSYSTFTWANKLDPGIPVIIPITPTLFEDDNDLEWNHPISEDYFGYNGSSVLDPGQNWSDLGSNPDNFNLPVLLHNGISNIRINGGTNGNFWDWRTGWFIPENELPHNLFYTRSSHKKEFNSTKVGGFFVNDMAHIKTSNDGVASRPIFQFNVLTSSGFNYEVASLYRAHELNLPVKYVELGNEFYLSDEEYLEVFPSSFDYISKANTFTQQLKSLAPFENVKVAVVGTSFSDNSAGRRSNWLNVILANISISGHRPDAITIHEYYSSGLTGTQLFASNIGKMFLKPLDKCKDLFENEIQQIKDKNLNSSLTPPLEVWLTEYNMNDDLAKNVGTWAHGLFNAIQTLKYLESPLITHICSHAMTSDAVYGNIFESDRGFKGLSQNQLPFNVSTSSAANFSTTKFGFTASGAANNEIALAMKGNNVIAHKIDFSSNANDIGYITYIGTVGQTITSTEYLNLYGWSFEKEEGFEAVILNLGNRNYSISSSDLTLLTSYGLITTTPLSMVQLTCFNPTAGISQIYGPTSTGTKGIHHLKTTGEIDIPGDLILPPYSLTRIIYRNPNTITVRLTDDEICEGTTTSILVQGANHSATITLNLTPSHNLSSSDSLFNLPNNLAAGTYNITASDGSFTSDPVTLIVHPAMSVTASITSGSDTPCADQDITLTADITTTSNDTNNAYTYLWVPDRHILDNNPFQKNIVLDNSLLTTEAYQVFVYDGQCWASSNVIGFDRGPKSIDLGDDFTVCSTDIFDLRALTTKSKLMDQATFHYSLLINGIEIISDQTSSDFTNLNSGAGLGVGVYTFRVESWSDNGVTENKNCPHWDEIEVNIVNCCSCSSNISLNPTPHSSEGNPLNNYSTESDMINVAKNNLTFFTVFPSSGDAETITIMGLTNNQICINGEFWIRNAELITKNLKTLVLQKCTLQLGPDALIKVRGRVKLILEGCVFKNCDGSTTMWDGIYVDVTNEAVAEPELEITKFVTTPTEITNAKNGVVARRDSPFKIEDCIFDNNYKDIVIEKYNKSGLAQDATIISGCTFNKTNALLAPYGGDKKFTAIELNEIEGRTIGDVTSANSISNSMYGIYSRNASFILLNTDFNDIEEDVLFPESGTGIYATSYYDYTNRKITLGNGNSNGSNTFKNSINGLLGVGEMNYYIYENKFGSSSPSEPISKFCIKIENSGGKEILIEDGNEFYEYTHGIDISEPLGKLYIHENIFHKALFPTNPINFEGTAINVYSSVPTNLYNSEISLNTIGSTSTDQTRIGIHLSLISKVNIKTNSILFKLDAVQTEPHVGIWTENCNEFKISDANEIENSTNFQVGTFGSSLTGIRLDASSMLCIEDNDFTKLGVGMHVTGNSIINSLYKNEFTFFDEGIFLDNDPYIGPSVGTQDPNNLNNGNVMRNVWNCSSCSTTTNRITGFISVGLKWYHDQALTSDPEFPDYPLTIGALDEERLTGTVTNDSECQLTSFISEEEDTGLPLTLRIRNETFGGIVSDSIRYPDGYYDAFRYNARQMAFNLLKKNLDLIVMDDDSDTSFVSFFNETLTSNINKIDSLETLLSKRLFVEADTLLNHFTDTNTIEYNYKRVYRLYIKLHLYGDTSLTNSEWDELYEIAYQHPLIGGLAVYVARNMLNLEVHDGELSSARMMQPKKQEEIGKLILYPNPANEYLKVKWTGSERISQVSIHDITGRIVLNSFNTDLLITSQLIAGLYFVKARIDENWFNETFVISR